MMISSSRQMSQPNPLQEQVSRILHSEAPTQLASQLKYLNSYESRVEMELRAKSEQISKLQNYLREEISNIQAIVNENNSLKKEVELLRNALAARTQQQEDTAKEAQMLAQLNRESSAIIRRLQQQLQEHELTPPMPPQPEKQESFAQTDPPANAVPGLLDKIASLEELVMQLKFEKNELQQRVGAYEEGCSSVGSALREHETSLQERRLTTAVVLEMVTEGELREVRFRGEMVQGLKQGRGICEYQEGISYEGDFHQGRRHGHGALLIQGHVLYRGSWSNNLIEGKGVIAMLQGEIDSYEGHFSQGRLEGYGCMKLKSGKRITALWKDGKIVGNCLEVFAHTKRYRKPELIQCY